MANPTTNYNFAMPTNSDLVKDLPADFEVFGQAVDTQMKTNADAAIAKSLLTTTGDTIYASGASTPARLGIGTTGQVLTVSGGLPAWATPTAAGTNWSLVNAGGTALTGATTITVSGISGADKLMVVVAGASSVNTGSYFSLRINSDSGTNYNQFGLENTASGTYSSGVFAVSNVTSGTSLAFGRAETGSANAIISGYCQITGGNASGSKMFNIAVGGSNPSTNSQMQNATGGYWTGSATISSISIISSTGNFDAGTIYIYKSA